MQVQDHLVIQMVNHTPSLVAKHFFCHIINFIVTDDQVCWNICNTYPVYLLPA
jgi:hypothetical protein